MSNDLIGSADLSDCEREPIHLPGAIQPFGFLLAVSATDWIVRHASSNVDAWLGVDASQIVGAPLDRILCEEAVHAIRGNAQSAIMGDSTARIFNLRLNESLCCDVAVHLTDELVIIECENTTEEAPSNAAAMVRGMVARLRKAPDDRAFFRAAARELRALTAFDRVMVYRFDESGAGEIIAESARAGLDSYLGLHCPASDIPEPARTLYERNWLRIIPDVDAPPVPIQPQRDAKLRPIDLSLSVLRSESPKQIKYLRNMGVRGFMSISILCEGRLWGLFACCHYESRYLGFARRTAAELFGQMFSLILENRERETEASHDRQAHDAHQRLIAAMAIEGQQFATIRNHLDDIAELLACDGIGLWMSGAVALLGRTPDELQFEKLIRYLQKRDIAEIFTSHHISADYPDGSEFLEQAAGMLVVPLSRPSHDFLIFFREEVTRRLNRTADPNKSISDGPSDGSSTLHKSFELWKKSVHGQSEPWRAAERKIAENLRVSLLEVILRLTDQTLDERRRSGEQQQLLIAELNHRVRNILGLIRGVLSQSKDPAHDVDSFTDVVGGRIQALARAHDLVTDETQGPASFFELLNAEGAAYIAGQTRRITVSGPDAYLTSDAFTTMALVIHEMLTNAVKYGALSNQNGTIAIDAAFDEASCYHIKWSETGGPPVTYPSRRGFGSTVIERSVRHNLGGAANVDYATEGLRAAFVIPGAHVRNAAEASAPGQTPDRSPERTKSLPDSVLLVEDNMLIALDAEEMLRSNGVGTVRIAASVADALLAIDEMAPAFTLLDVSLGSETSFPIADRLMELGHPFAFATGYGEQVVFKHGYAGVTRIRKPYSVQSLIDGFRAAG
jgi:light-regulated signal transduction histidine kinase (bacteriophytochrome)